MICVILLILLYLRYNNGYIENFSCKNLQCAKKKVKEHVGPIITDLLHEEIDGRVAHIVDEAAVDLQNILNRVLAIVNQEGLADLFGVSVSKSTENFTATYDDLAEKVAVELLSDAEEFMAAAVEEIKDAIKVMVEEAKTFTCYDWSCASDLFDSWDIEMVKAV